ncbi:enoyl-CoA hydratase/isomerase [Dickeya chrysanthemi]|uniref:Enoyl-CoA hydratase/isomerase n=1 Tax=Dickeya chrysanthemi TaxID=556 RepID=A0ABU8JJM6_DICCH|nr:enoyl-CoA hydratase/isomerase [Dickeya chrysanthemi]MCA7007019.1 enoyl-CoA hydratase/isomerase [Dickeya chrysanthemi]
MAFYQTIRLRQEGPVLYLQIHRPEANNTINENFAIECREVIRQYRDSISILVVEGLPEVFCFGADLHAIEQGNIAGNSSGGRPQDPEILYEVWQDMMSGPYISIAHVRGKANAGGIGFVAASDIVIADTRALFSLSEMLFGLLPACVLPFLVHKIGKQKAHYMTLMTKPVSAEQAYRWGLVDDYGNDSDLILKKHIQRLNCLSKRAITRYKSYMSELVTLTRDQKPAALALNVEIFSDQENLNKISRYIQTGKYPWEE